MKLSVVLLVLLCLPLAGCVERTVTITSEPPGALVTMSSVEVGRTPVKVPYTWYGDYEIIIRQEGCQTLKTHQELNPPWYDFPPIDLLSTLAPWTYHNDTTLHYVLNKSAPLNDEEIKARAEQLRLQNKTAGE